MLTPLRVAQGKPKICETATITGEVQSGKSFAAKVTPDLVFIFEAIQSGWIARVVRANSPREEHDYAELATPPYQSVTPLAVSTDYSFRAQDAAAWNPRRFRYAASAAEFEKLKALYGPATHGDATAASALAQLASEQPAAELTILEAHLLPGTRDQTGPAGAVASHLSATPYVVDPGQQSALGRLNAVRFRVVFSLPIGSHPGKGVEVTTGICQGSRDVLGPNQPERSKRRQNE